MNLEDYIKDLDSELQEKARACGSAEELLALAKEAKVPLPDEALAAIAGGDNSDPDGCGKKVKCPRCGSTDTYCTTDYDMDQFWHCKSCGYNWT